MSGNLISSIAWVPRGRAALAPQKYNLDEAELERVGKLGGPAVIEHIKEQMEKMETEEGDDGWEDMGDDAAESDDDEDEDEKPKDTEVEMDTDKPAETKPFDPNDLSAYNLDNYDNEESTSMAMGAFANVKGLQFYRDNNDDPYITLKENDDEIEQDELKLEATDNIIVAARTTSDLSSIDFHVYDDGNESLYTHHDLMIPTIPLCVEWLDFPASSSSDDPTRTGNYIAVGGFDPTIEIWDGDVVDALYPQAILGPATSLQKPEAKPKGTGKKKRRQMIQPEANDEYHVQPVLSLSWTNKFRNLLLSGSVDATVKLWDLSRESPMGASKSWRNLVGGEKVQGLEWNRGAAGSGVDTAVLAGGERLVKVWDPQTKEGDGFGVRVGADIECVRWDPWSPTSFYVSLENGLIVSYDARTLSSSKDASGLSSAAPKFTLQAHDGPASALDINPHIRGCMLTAGMDKTVKIWNISDEETEGVAGRKRDISLSTSRDLGLGKIFAARWNPDPEVPLTLAAAGSKAKLQVWDVASNPGARKAFGDRLRRHGRELNAIKKSGGVMANNDGDDTDESDAE